LRDGFPTRRSRSGFVGSLVDDARPDRARQASRGLEACELSTRFRDTTGTGSQSRFHQVDLAGELGHPRRPRAARPSALIGGVVGARVAGAQQAGQHLAATTHQQRVRPEPALVVPGRALLLGARSPGSNRVQGSPRQGPRPSATPARGPKPARGGSCRARRHPAKPSRPRGRHRRHHPAQRRLAGQRSQIRDALAAVTNATVGVNGFRTDRVPYAAPATHRREPTSKGHSWSTRPEPANRPLPP
jgi:hypothetical protein